MIKKLQDIGLTEKQSQVYLALVKSGESSANHISKQISTNRTVTYNILHQLIEKGLVSYTIKNGKRSYSITDPSSIVNLVKEKETLAKDLAKEINKVKPRQQSNNNVEVYEGLEGLKIIFQEIRNAKELRILNATGLVFEHLKYSAVHIVKDIGKKNVKVIATSKMEETPLSQFKNIPTKYLPKEADNYATTFIFSNRIIIFSLKDKPFLVKIKNKEIFEGYKKDFDVLWSKLNP